MTSWADTSDVGAIDIVNDISSSDHDNDHDPPGDVDAPAMQTLQISRGRPAKQKPGTGPDFPDEDIAASNSGGSDRGNNDSMNDQSISNHGGGENRSNHAEVLVEDKTPTMRGRPAKRKAGTGRGFGDEDSAASSSDASQSGASDPEHVAAMSDHDDDHDPGGDIYAPTMHTSRAERAPRRQAIQTSASNPAPKQPSRKITTSEDLNGRGPKRKQPPLQASEHSVQDISLQHLRLDEPGQAVQHRLKRRRMQNSTGPAAEATESEQEARQSGFVDEVLEPARRVGSPQQRAARARERARPALGAAAVPFGADHQMASDGPMDMMPMLPGEGACHRNLPAS